MPTINAEYKAELDVNKLLMQAATYTIEAQGENNIKYAVDTALTSYDDTNGTLLSAETEITVSEYITFVSDKGYMILNISTEDTGIVFGTVQTKEEKTDEDVSYLVTQTEIVEKTKVANRLIDLTKMFTFEDSIIHIFGGLDSLTDGAGDNGGALGDSYFNYLTNSLVAHFGDAGAGWTSLDNRVASRNVMNLGNSGFDYIKDLAKGDSPSIYSLDFGGVHAASGVQGNYINMGWLDSEGYSREWETVDIYYLQQPGGAEIQFYQAGTTPANRLLVDTDGELSLQHVTVTYSSSYTNTITSRVEVDGIATVFGYLWKSGATKGVMCSKMAFGGYQTKEFADYLDDTFQTQWLSELAPTYYLFNGGRNDITESTPTEFMEDVDTYIGRFPTDTVKILFSPHEASNDDVNEMSEYRSLLYDYANENGHGYINDAEVLGAYDEAVRLGLMLDTAHASERGNLLRALNALKYLGIPLYQYTEPNVFT